MLQEMLEVLRDHQNNEHMSHLEWIVIILIALAVSHLVHSVVLYTQLADQTASFMSAWSLSCWLAGCFIVSLECH